MPTEIKLDDKGIISLVNLILAVAFTIYNSISQTQGTTPIPTWEEITSKHTILQTKIDLEKGV